MTSAEGRGDGFVMDPNATVMMRPPVPRSPRVAVAELLIFVAYVFGATLWILGSDWLLAWITDSPEETMALQTYKGLNFVVTTGLLLYFVLRRSYSRRRQAEQVSREYAERFELVARASNDTVWDWHLDSGSMWWSDGFTTLFGNDEGLDEPALESLRARLHPEDRDRVVQGLEGAIQGGKGVWVDEFRFRQRDGGYAEVLGRGFVVRDTAGKALRVVGGITDMRARKRAEAELRLSQQQLRALSGRLESLREEERIRIAREIHDELGQVLTGLKMQLRWIEDRVAALGPASAANAVIDQVVESTGMADDAIRAVQRIVAELRPAVLDNLGLLAAVRLEGERFAGRLRVPVELRLPEELPPVPPDAALACFRVVQEALTNVARHAAATRVTLSLQAPNGSLVLEIEDDGKGLPPGAVEHPGSLGLLGMQERALRVGGSLRFFPGEPRGTRVVLRLPLDAPPVEVRV